jgi:hypothetical protein
MGLVWNPYIRAYGSGGVDHVWRITTRRVVGSRMAFRWGAVLAGIEPGSDGAAAGKTSGRSRVEGSGRVRPEHFAMSKSEERRLVRCSTPYSPLGKRLLSSSTFRSMWLRM